MFMELADAPSLVPPLCWEPGISSCFESPIVIETASEVSFSEIIGCYSLFLYSVMGSFENLSMRMLVFFLENSNFYMIFGTWEVAVGFESPRSAFSSTFFLFSWILFGILAWLEFDYILIPLVLLYAIIIYSTACKGKGSRSFLIVSLRLIFFSFS